ncbi:MAG: D-alanine--D-alanine ligase [Bacteroidetes bacterium]|nr:D-alanine--D-alanine ligase [Bacteroidota bacterium]
MKIAVLLGGTSPERYVSMASGKGIALALAETGHSVQVYDVALGTNALVEIETLELPTEVAPSAEELAAMNRRGIIDAIQSLPDDIDVAFMALHGAPGEDGTVQSLLELRGIPYTGSGILASALAMDKAMSKRIFEHYDIPTPRWFQLPAGQADATELMSRVDQDTAYPVVVKPNDGGSTVGLTIVNDPGELVEAYQRAGRYSETVLFEEFIEGRELTVTILGGESLPVVEIRPKSGFYDYANKYTAGRTEYFCPADLPRDIEEETRELARRAHEALGCSGYSRVDFRLDPDNALYCLEVNTLPGMTATSLVPKAAAAAGMNYAALCDRIIQLAIGTERAEA